MLMSFKYRQTDLEKKRVLFVSLEGRIGGAEISLLLLVKYLRKDIRVAVACPAENGLAKQLNQMQVASLNLPEPPRQYHSSSKRLVYLIKAGFELTRIIYKVKPTIVHANSFFAAMICVLPVILTGRRLVWHARDLGRFRMSSRLCGFFCKRVIAVSDAVKDSLVRGGIKAEKIVVVHNGVEAGNYQPDVHTRRNGEAATFANIGQFVRWKRQNLFLEAAYRFIQKGGQGEFVLIGDDIFGRDYKYKAELLNKIGDYQTAERISYLGWQENLEEVWGQIGCLVHTAYQEPFGRVIIEAMAHKVPVIAIKGNVPAEIIQDGKTGILVESGEVEGLSDAMLEIAGSKILAMKLATSGYEQVTSQFSAEETANRVRKIYEQILAA